jgi:hypothetical protein
VSQRRNLLRSKRCQREARALATGLQPGATDSSLGDRSPDEFTRRWNESSAASLRTAGPANNPPAGAVQSNAAADPKLIQLFVPPSAEVKGGSEKLSKDSKEQASEQRELLEVVN